MLTRSQIDLAWVNNGYQAVPMRKTGLPAHVVLGEAALSVIDTYLKERNDDSPFVFIQQGRISAPPRKRSPSEQAYQSRTKGYGGNKAGSLMPWQIVPIMHKYAHIYNPGRGKWQRPD